MSAKQVLARKVSPDQIKIVHNDHRPEAEVNRLVLLVGSELVCLRWGEADRIRQWLCAAYADVEIVEPITPRAGIAKVF